MDVDDKSSVDKLSKIREAYATALKEQKEMFILIFQRFTQILTEYVVRDGDQNNLWFKVCLGRYKEIRRKYHKQFAPFLTSLENLLFVESGEQPQIVRDAFNSWPIKNYI